MSATANEKPTRRSVTEWTLERLYDEIFTGALKPGDPLGEVDLADRLGVSRSPVRLALRELETSGLIEVRSGRGERVLTTLRVADVAELYEIRSSLEQLAARKAAERIEPAGLARLETVQAEMERSSEMRSEGERRDFELDFDFHLIIARSSGLPRLEAVLTPLWRQSHVFLRGLNAIGAYGDREEDEAAYGDHRRILDGLRRRDGAAAATAMREHLEGRSARFVEAARSLDAFD
jgi:DNA-binding GntR family transcriptional regulator